MFRVQESVSSAIWVLVIADYIIYTMCQDIYGQWHSEQYYTSPGNSYRQNQKW